MEKKVINELLVPKGFLGCSNATRWSRNAEHIATLSNILHWQLEYIWGVQGSAVIRKVLH